jgi:hypothetical protein
MFMLLLNIIAGIFIGLLGFMCVCWILNIGWHIVKGICWCCLTGLEAMTNWIMDSMEIPWVLKTSAIGGGILMITCICLLLCGTL